MATSAGISANHDTKTKPKVANTMKQDPLSDRTEREIGPFAHQESNAATTRPSEEARERKAKRMTKKRPMKRPIAIFRAGFTRLLVGHRHGAQRHALARRKFSVALLSCPQAARMSRPRGVRTGEA